MHQAAQSLLSTLPASPPTSAETGGSPSSTFPRHKERVLPGALGTADGLGGALVSGVAPPGLPAGPLGKAGSGGRGTFLVGGWAGGRSSSPVGGGLAASHSRASGPGSLISARGKRWVFMRSIREVQILKSETRKLYTVETRHVPREGQDSLTGHSSQGGLV